MTTQQFLYNMDLDIWLRKHFALPYVLSYLLAYAIAYSLAVPAPFLVPLFDIPGVREVSAASSWAFLFAYPVFHLLMRSRLLCRYTEASFKVLGVLIGLFVLALLTFFLLLRLGDGASSGLGRLLRTPAGAAVLQLMVAMVISLGAFLVLEPVRERLRAGR